MAPSAGAEEEAEEEGEPASNVVMGKAGEVGGADAAEAKGELAGVTWSDDEGEEFKPAVKVGIASVAEGG